jgi:hypothetical protein
MLCWPVLATRDLRAQSIEPQSLQIPVYLDMDEMDDFRSVKSSVGLIWRTYISVVWSN